MDISFLISTNRPELANVVIDYLNKIGSCEDYKYEICVFSPTTFGQRNVVNFHDKGGGPLYGFNLMGQRSKGNTLCVLVDDHLPSYNIFSIINFLKNDIFLDRKMRISTLKSGSSCWIPQGPPFPDKVEDLKDSKILMLRWPILTRDTLHDYLNGHIFHPSFQYHWADNYLSYYVNKIDGNPVECNFVKLYQVINTPKYNDVFDIEDYYIFRELVNKLGLGQEEYI